MGNPNHDELGRFAEGSGGGKGISKATLSAAFVASGGTVKFATARGDVHDFTAKSGRTMAVFTDELGAVKGAKTSKGNRIPAASVKSALQELDRPQRKTKSTKLKEQVNDLRGRGLGDKQIAKELNRRSKRRSEIEWTANYNTNVVRRLNGG